MRMRNLKTFSTTRFPNTVRAIFYTLVDDYKAVLKCLEDIKAGEDNGSEARKRADEAKGILRKVLSKSFVLQLSGTSDIYQNFSPIFAKLLISCLMKGLTVSWLLWIILRKWLVALIILSALK